MEKENIINPDDHSAEDLVKIQKQAEEYLNGWKRAKADLINYKKDETQRFGEVIKFANETIILDMVVVLDNLSLAISSMENSDNNCENCKGVKMIESQLYAILKQRGLERMANQVGESFNPSIHEAVATSDTEAKLLSESGIIIEEIGVGYLLNGKVIKPAKVKVN